MMASLSAREYKEWEAYERAVGPLDQSYEREITAQLHELIQMNNQLTGASLTKKGKKNPAGKFRKAYRPEYFTNPYLQQEEDEALANEEPDDDDEEFVDEDIDDGDDFVADDEPPHDPHAYDPSRDPFA